MLVLVLVLVLVLRAGPGLAPAGEVLVLCFAKEKYPKERRPCSLRPLRGKPAAGCLRGAPWNSLCAGALRSDNHGESVDEACARRRPCSPPNRPAAGAARRGWAAQKPNSHTGHCCARPSLRSARRLRPSGLGRAQQWPVWLSGFQVPFRMRRGAQRPADQGSRLSERSEFERDPAGCEHRRLPAAKRRDAACRVAFSWLTFFWRGKRK